MAPVLSAPSCMHCIGNMPILIWCNSILGFEEHSVFATVNTKRLSCYSVEYYYYCCCYAAFDAPCVRHKDDKSQAQVLNAFFACVSHKTNFKISFNFPVSSEFRTMHRCTVYWLPLDGERRHFLAILCRRSTDSGHEVCVTTGSVGRSLDAS